jgi:hypothetical protein
MSGWRRRSTEIITGVWAGWSLPRSYFSAKCSISAQFVTAGRTSETAGQRLLEATVGCAKQ